MHIYIQPTEGDDANGGTGPDDAVLTHERVLEIIDALPPPPPLPPIEFELHCILTPDLQIPITLTTCDIMKESERRT